MLQRVASLISGGGTTMCELAKACFSGQVRAEFACVIASTAKAGGLEKARRLGLSPDDVLVVDPESFKSPGGKIDRAAFGEALLRELKKREIQIVLQNGWLPLTPLNVIAAFPGKIFNQHPGPVPEFGGKGMFGRRVHAAVLLYRRMTKTEPWTEVIAQRVAEKFDEGTVLKREQVPILPGDTVDDLQQRALPVEHRLQIELLSDVIAGREDDLPARPSLVTAETLTQWEYARAAGRYLYPQG
jgi:phosphoribosylglycinamide formyltransferase-1